MKLILVLCLVAVAIAAPPNVRVEYPKGNDVYITSYENENVGDGNYKYGFEQSDGQKLEQEGQILNEGREDESIAIRGSYVWIGPDGVTYRVTYVADDNGFQPEIEQGPGGGVPPAVVASLLG